MGDEKKKIGEEKSGAQGESSIFFRRPFRQFPSPPLSASGSPRMEMTITSVPVSLCRSGRRRSENVCIFKFSNISLK